MAPRSAGFAPSLNLVPGAAPGARELPRMWRRWKFHGRKPRRAQKRIHQRPILSAQSLHFFFE